MIPIPQLPADCTCDPNTWTELEAGPICQDFKGINDICTECLHDWECHKHADE